MGVGKVNLSIVPPPQGTHTDPQKPEPVSLIALLPPAQPPPQIIKGHTDSHQVPGIALLSSCVFLKVYCCRYFPGFQRVVHALPHLILPFQPWFGEAKESA